jgi:hypothetical protein
MDLVSLPLGELFGSPKAFPRQHTETARTTTRAAAMAKASATTATSDKMELQCKRVN